MAFTLDGVPVTGYIPPDLKRRLLKVKRLNRHLTVSRMIEEALRQKIDELEQQTRYPQSPKPKQH